MAPKKQTSSKKEAAPKKQVSPKKPASPKKEAPPKKEVPSKTKAKRTQIETSLVSNELDERLNTLERAVGILQNQQNEIFYKIENIYQHLDIKFSDGIKRELKEEDVFRVIKICVQNNESRWIKLDDIISVLKLNQEQDRRALNKLLIKMFNTNLIDLAEGGDPKYPLIYQNKEFGMIALQ